MTEKKIEEPEFVQPESAENVKGKDADKEHVSDRPVTLEERAGEPKFIGFGTESDRPPGTANPPVLYGIGGATAENKDQFVYATVPTADNPEPERITVEKKEDGSKHAYVSGRKEEKKSAEKSADKTSDEEVDALLKDEDFLKKDKEDATSKKSTSSKK